MKVLIIGLGSIAYKHINALLYLYPEAKILALRSGNSANEHKQVESVYSISEVPEDIDFVLISNPTGEHYNAIKKVATLNKPLFIEKPSFLNMKQADEISTLIEKIGIRTYTAFNFRFHPAIIWLKNNIDRFRVLEVQAYCGSYLPDWRPHKDYREVYSAKDELGGGVNLDLIHELDYILWLFGKPEKSSVFTNRISDLEINSSDMAHYFLQYQDMVASIILNYYRKDAKRQIEIVTDTGSLFVNLLNSEIKDQAGKVLFKDNSPIIETYTSQMRYFTDNLKRDKPYMNSVLESSISLNYALNNITN
jgi:predicted dehydrogenase